MTIFYFGDVATGPLGSGTTHPTISPLFTLFYTMIDDTMVDNTMVDDTMIRHGSVHWVLSFLICISKMIFLSEVLIANSIQHLKREASQQQKVQNHSVPRLFARVKIIHTKSMQN